MHQVSVCPATADRRSPWHALRPVLVLGGFLAIWWALMTGVAHAESTPEHHGLVDQVGSRLDVEHHDSHPVREVVRRVHHDVKTTATKVTETVKPVTTQIITTTKSVRTALSETVENTVNDTVKNPVTAPVSGPVSGTAGMPESSMVQGDSHSGHHAIKALSSSPSELLSPTSAQPGSFAAPDRDRALTGAHAPLQTPRETPVLPDPCSSPSGSGPSPSHTPVGITESSLLVMPSVVADHHLGRLARLPGGPAHKPSSSPD